MLPPQTKDLGLSRLPGAEAELRSSHPMVQITQRVNNIQDVVETGLCIGCGICAYSDAIGAMHYSGKHAQSLPILTATNRKDFLAFALCPGKGYNIIEESSGLYGPAPYDLDLGHVDSCCAAFSNDRDVLANASSGGLMSQIAIYLLENDLVDRVLVTNFTYDSAPRAACMLAGSKSEILNSQGSKYCPVDLSSAVREIKHSNYRVAVLGTPCHIAGIRNIQKHDPDFREKVVITIANFCGGVKSYRNLDLLTSRHGIAPRAVTFFRFRGNGQPGSMSISDQAGKTVEVPYPKYVGHTGVPKHLRCHLCVDATGELADIACGDAWLPRFQGGKNPWSIVIARNAKAAEIVQAMIQQGIITAAPVSLDEIRRSQHENLASKKTRQKSRQYLYRLLGRAIPYFDGGYRDNPLVLSTEIKVFVKHSVKHLLEKTKLFYLAYKLVKRHSRL
jgi:coenzyme F420 hydrogenase subunit beta